MAKKIAKLKPSTKMKITKWFKAGKTIDEIKAGVVVEFPKITPGRIRTVIRKHLFGLCDDLWSDAVKARDGGRCIISGKSTGLNSHHLVGRNNTNHRWTVENGVTLAADYHTLGGDMAAHGSTDVTQAFAEWMVINRWEQWQQFQINRHIKDVCKVDIDALLNISKGLQYQLDKLKSRPKTDLLARRKVKECAL